MPSGHTFFLAFQSSCTKILFDGLHFRKCERNNDALLWWRVRYFSGGSFSMSVDFDQDRAQGKRYYRPNG